MFIKQQELKKILEEMSDKDFLIFFEGTLAAVAMVVLNNILGKVSFTLGEYHLKSEDMAGQQLVRQFYSLYLEVPMLCMEEAIRRWGRDGEWSHETDYSFMIFHEDDTITCQISIAGMNDVEEVALSFARHYSEVLSFAYNLTAWDSKGIESKFIEPPVLELEW